MTNKSGSGLAPAKTRGGVGGSGVSEWPDHHQPLHVDRHKPAYLQVWAIWIATMRAA